MESGRKRDGGMARTEEEVENERQEKEGVTKEGE